MPLKRDSLAVILNRVYANYIALFKPLDKTPRMGLLKVFSNADTGMYHRLPGDVELLSRRLLPDTAEGGFLREHWSSRLTPLYATGAAGEIIATELRAKQYRQVLFCSRNPASDITLKARIRLKAAGVWSFM